MKKNQTAPLVLSIAAITAMSQVERIDAFKKKDQTASRLFMECGKLLVGIRAALKDPSQATALLKKKGIRPGTVNTASETARVFTELVPAHLAEEVFDQFTWGDVRAINRAMSGASKRKLTPPEVAALIQAAPQNFDEELESIFLTGFTIAEADAQAEQELQAAAQVKAEADRHAAEKAEQKKQSAIAAALQQQQREQQPPPIPEPPPAASSTAPAGSAADQGATSPALSNVVSMPADPDSALPEILAAIDELVVAASSLSTDARKAIFAKLNEAMGFLAESIDEPAAA